MRIFYLDSGFLLNLYLCCYLSTKKNPQKNCGKPCFCKLGRGSWEVDPFALPEPDIDIAFDIYLQNYLSNIIFNECDSDDCIKFKNYHHIHLYQLCF